MSGAFKAVGSVFKGVGNFLGIGKAPKRPAPTEAPTLKDYSAVGDSDISSAQARLDAAQERYNTLKKGPPRVTGDRFDKQNARMEYRKKLEGATSNLLSARSSLKALQGKQAATPLERNPNILGAPGSEALLSRWDSLMAQYKGLEKPPRGRDESEARAKYAKTKRGLEKQIVSLETQIMGQIWRAPAGTTTQPQTTTQTGTPTQTATQTQGQPTPTAADAPLSSIAESVVGTQALGTVGAQPARGGGTRRGRRGRISTLLSDSQGGPERFGG